MGGFALFDAITAQALAVLGEPVTYQRGDIAGTIQGLFGTTGQPEDLQLGNVMALTVRTADVVALFPQESLPEPRVGDLAFVRGGSYDAIQVLTDAGGATRLILRLQS